MDGSVLDTDILSEGLKRRNGAVGRRADEYVSMYGHLTTTTVTVLKEIGQSHTS